MRYCHLFLVLFLILILFFNELLKCNIILSSHKERDLVCEKCCRSDGKVKITSELIALPKTLIIHLKRFRYEEARETFVKVNTAVSFPLHLDLLQCGGAIQHPEAVTSQLYSPDVWNQSPQDVKTSAEDFVSFFPAPDLVQLQSSSSSGGSSSSSASSYRRNENNELYTYTLCAVVRHVGRGRLTGHYVCDIADDSSGKSSSNINEEEDEAEVETVVDCDLTGDRLWKRCDDSKVTKIEQVRI